MIDKMCKFDEAVFVTASFFADELVRNSSAATIGSDKYEFIHRAKKIISDQLSEFIPEYDNAFIVGISHGVPDAIMTCIVNFKPELLNYLPKDISVVIDPNNDYRTVLFEGEVGSDNFKYRCLS